MDLNSEINSLRDNIIENKLVLDKKLNVEYNSLNIFFEKKNYLDNLFNLLDTKVNNFYDSLTPEKTKIILDIQDNKNFIYYFSIFYDFDTIGLFFLYQNNLIKKYNDEKFKEIIIFFENEYNKIFELFMKDIDNENFKEREKLFTLFKDFLDIPANSKEDKELIKLNLINKRKHIEEIIFKDNSYIDIKIIEDKLIIEEGKLTEINNELIGIKETYNDTLTMKEDVDKNIQKMKKNLKIKRLNINIQEEKKKYEQLQKQKGDIVSDINIKSSNLEKERKALINLESKNNLVSILNERNDLNVKMDKIGNIPVFKEKLIQLNNKIDSIKENNDIEIILIKNRIEKYEKEILSLNNNLEMINKDLKKMIEKKKINCERNTNLEDEELMLSQYLKNLMSEIRNKYSEIKKQQSIIDQLDQSLKKKKIIYLKKNKKLYMDYERVKNINEKVNEYFKLIEEKEEESKETIRKINYNSIDEKLEKIFTGVNDKYYNELNNIFKWKLNINIQIKMFESCQIRYKDIVNSLNYKLYDILKSQDKIIILTKQNIENFTIVINKIKDMIITKNLMEKIIVELDKIQDDIYILEDWD